MPAPFRRHLRLLAVLSALTLVGAGCGDDDDGDDPTIEGTSGDAAATDAAATDGGDDGGEAAAGDPCSLLTPADLEAAIGSPYDAGEATHQDQTGGDQCVWSNTDAPPVKIFSVVVYTTDGLEGTPIGQAAEDAAAFYEINKAAVTPDEELNLGDDSFRAATELWVLDGDTAYTFSTFTGTSKKAIAAMKTLAEKAVGG